MITTEARDQVTIAALKAMGFSDDIMAAPRRIIVSSSGREKTGKTHFALTGPEPIIYLNIDIGAEGVVNKFQEAGKQVLVYDIRVPKTATQDVYVPLYADLKQKVSKVYSLHAGTVIWDTSSEAFELARLAKFGKLTQVMPHNYTEVNNEWRELLRVAYDSPMNTVFIHKMKPKYINNARTGEYELSGFGEMDYLAQLNLVHYREPGEEEGDEPKFSAYIKDSRSTPSVIGTVLNGPMCNFDFLLSLVHGAPKST